MTQYKCGHESEIIVADGGVLTIAAYFEWRETVGSEGTREKCWACWGEERTQNSEQTLKEDG